MSLTRHLRTDEPSRQIARNPRSCRGAGENTAGRRSTAVVLATARARVSLHSAGITYKSMVGAENNPVRSRRCDPNGSVTVPSAICGRCDYCCRIGCVQPRQEDLGCRVSTQPTVSTNRSGRKTSPTRPSSPRAEAELTKFCNHDPRRVPASRTESAGTSYNEMTQTNSAIIVAVKPSMEYAERCMSMHWQRPISAVADVHPDGGTAGTCGLARSPVEPAEPGSGRADR